MLDQGAAAVEDACRLFMSSGLDGPDGRATPCLQKDEVVDCAQGMDQPAEVDSPGRVGLKTPLIPALSILISEQRPPRPPSTQPTARFEAGHPPAQQPVGSSASSNA